MSMIYKLGDGPINYDWNPRYVTIEGTEIFYSPSQLDKDRKTINIYEGAVSNICKIKGKNFSICVILPPPTNKSLFFASDTYEEILTFRNNVLKATLNNVEGRGDNTRDRDVFLTKENKIRFTSSSQLKYLKKGSTNFMTKGNNNKNSSSDLITQLFTQNLPEEFKRKLEALKNELILNETKFESKFKGDLKVSIPTNYSKFEYGDYFISLSKNIFILFFLIFLIHFFFTHFIFIYILPNNLNYEYSNYCLQNFVEIITFFFLFKNNKKITFLNNFIFKANSSLPAKCDYIVKASTIFEGDKNEILALLCNLSLRAEWDYFIKNAKDITVKNNFDSDKTKYANNYSVKYTLPYVCTNLLTSIGLFNNNSSTENESSMTMEIIKYVDNKNNYYIAFRQKSCNSSSSSSSSLSNDTGLFELFVLIPVKDIDDEKTLVIFLTNFDASSIELVSSMNYNNNSQKFLKMSTPFFMNQQLKEERLNILSTLKEYLKVSFVNIKSKDFAKLVPDTETTQENLNRVVGNNNIKYELNINAISDISKLNNNQNTNKKKRNLLIDEEPEIYMNSDANMDTVRSFRSELFDQNNYEYEKTEKVEINNNFQYYNPESIITNGEHIPLEERFPGYLKNPTGGVECRSYEELKTQDGIILEVMKRAGRQLLEGKNIVAVSLPVRIFEPRSTLTRITDNWGAGPFYLNKMAKSSDPIEKMKMLISFAISGMHTNIKQLKPFNPILGETYEALWHDGSKIYVEHISHHPPMSRFLIIAANKSWKFYGYYEYLVKLKSLTGNVIGGQFKGPNIVELENGEKYSFIFPVMNISGLMYGKRIIDWEGSLNFINEETDITASITFIPPPKFYQKFVDPTDVFRGELKKGETVVHKIFGSPIDKLVFDTEIYWELETVDMIKACEPNTCLPSDCRYRTDLMAVAVRNMPLAEDEKLRLEVLQRSDRALRQKYNKGKH